MVALFSTTGATGAELKISDAEFVQLRDFIYVQCGIYVADNRKYLLENRLANRLKLLNLKNFGEYYHYLQYDTNKKTELSKLFEVITTNETSFYRNPPQLKVFQENILTEVIAEQKKKGEKKLRIWSAGCSTGEEPYTLAIIIAEVLKGELAGWDVRITASDLSERVLEAARKGLYNEYTLRTTPKEIVTRYFEKDGENFRVKQELKRLISFGQLNLSDRAALKRVERSQLVFCRNVIIYFDDEMKKKVIGAFYDNLLPGGYLLIGHSESLHNITRSFKPIHYPGAIMYKKEA
ncbi:CheR family methyltransferase [Humidesulfovibrio idahonensis]